MQYLSRDKKKWGEKNKKQKQQSGSWEFQQTYW